MKGLNEDTQENTKNYWAFWPLTATLSVLWDFSIPELIDERSKRRLKKILKSHKTERVRGQKAKKNL